MATKASKNFIQIVNLLVENEADIYAMNMHGDNVLFSAAINGQALEDLQELERKGVPWNMSNKYGKNILHLAVESGNLKVLQHYITKGAAVDARDQDGTTPLMRAACATIKNFPAVVDLLVENGADIRAVNNYGYNVLSCAAMTGQSPDDLKLIERRGVPWHMLNKDDQNILHIAVESGNLKVLQHYIKNGADVNARDQDGTTPLIRTARVKITNFTEVVDFLVENGADLQAVDRYGQSVLHIAVKLKPISDVRFLVERGCAWDKTHNGGQSILHSAANCGNLEAIEYFISLGANVNSRCENGCTPLFSAVPLPTKTFFLTVVELLVRNGADINAATDDLKGKFSVLHEAAKIGDVDKCKFLISLGADINASDKNVATPIMYACPRIASAVVKFFVENGADIRQTDGRKFTLIDYSVKHGVPGTELNALIKMGARWDTANRFGKSVLHLAASYGNLEALRYFRFKGFDVNGRDVFGWTPLSCAVKHKPDNFQEVAEILVKNGVDINAVDNEGKNAVLLGLENGLDKLGVEKLISLGCCWWCPSKNGKTVFHRIIKKKNTDGNNFDLLEYIFSLRNEHIADFILH